MFQSITVIILFDAYTVLFWVPNKLFTLASIAFLMKQRCHGLIVKFLFPGLKSFFWKALVLSQNYNTNIITAITKFKIRVCFCFLYFFCVLVLTPDMYSQILFFKVWMILAQMICNLEKKKQYSFLSIYSEF